MLIILDQNTQLHNGRNTNKNFYIYTSINNADIFQPEYSIA